MQSKTRKKIILLTRRRVLNYLSLLVFFSVKLCLLAEASFVGIDGGIRKGEKHYWTWTPMIYSASNQGEIHHSENDSLLDALIPAKSCDVTQMSPTTLAYVGDAVYELFVRSRYAWPSRRTTAYRDIVVGIVRAETQSEFLLKLLLNSSEEAKGEKDEPFDTPLLSAEELNICRRGRNAVGKNSGRTPKRLGADQNVYQDSTAWEALLGYLYITDAVRCKEILEWAGTQMPPIR